MEKIVTLLGLFLLLGCSGNVEAPVTKEEEPEIDMQSLIEEEERIDRQAHNLLLNTCFTCHNRNLAPNMEDVKGLYITEGVTKEQFVETIVDWVFNPTVEKSRNEEARNKWGLMPKQEFKEEDVRTVARYIYDNDVSDTLFNN